MKFFVYLASILLIIALAGLFVLKKPNGQTWLSAESFLPTTQLIKEKVNTAKSHLQSMLKTDTLESEASTPIYRWKDSNGDWNYSDKPSSTIPSEEVFLDSKDVIVLPAFDVSSVKSNTVNSKNKADNSPSNTLVPTPSKVLDLYKDANNVQKLMDTREQEISKAIKENTG